MQIPPLGLTVDFTSRRSARTWKTGAPVLVGGVATLVLGAGVAVAATGWSVSLASGSNAGAQAAGLSPITVTATASVAAGSGAGQVANQLYPGASGDVVLVISNPNAFPVSVSSITTPASSTYATGYSDAALTSATSGCDSTTSTVAWSGTGATAHAIAVGGSPIVVPAKTGGSNGSVTLTLTNAAVMGGAPAACAGQFFRMPALTATNATSAAPSSTATTSPATGTYS